ncbi:hypothetical protein PILCRDRAFT_826888 [Piloderma croceum F 1598]|uniref:G-alpha-domain-containing protein n=1 Tax=Piloderma croceum (strain F 1598) TaxID=765440 RepID=A0A0C3APM2_PILCF|nr:hypothetical protein PILCRDRAFT_826888 [Piloderma croceum F 1598]
MHTNRVPQSTPDPLAVFTDPPPNETDEQRVVREAKEAEEKRVSDEIDEGIRKDKVAMKKEKELVVKVLLLGQSESGKSTTLKNFRLRYARQAWKEERTSWRAVIQLNLIHSVNTILEALQAELESDSSSSVDLDNFDPDGYISAMSTSTSARSPSSTPPPKVTEKHRLLKLRLAPLRRVESDLRRRLGASTSDDIDNVNGSSQPTYATPFDASTTSYPPPPAHGSSRRRRIGAGGGEVVVRSWKHLLQAEERVSQTPSSSRGRREKESEQGGRLSDPDAASEAIANSKADIKALWEDPVVQTVLTQRKVKLADSAGFFLSQLGRIASRRYEPSDDDVIRARLRTLGVQEHKLKIEGGIAGATNEAGRDWYIYDVGGSRTMRPAWLPYFDDVNAIIFLAPISCFDEQLVEDRNVNRLEDSFGLWKAICSSPQLSQTTLILFMNKCDLLEKKIKSGVSVKKSLPSFGDRPNDAASVTKYLKTKFKEISQQCSPPSRTLYIFPTSVTDTQATGITLQTVRDGILREHLRHSNFV